MRTDCVKALVMSGVLVVAACGASEDPSTSSEQSTGGASSGSGGIGAMPSGGSSATATPGSGGASVPQGTGGATGGAVSGSGGAFNSGGSQATGGVPASGGTPSGGSGGGVGGGTAGSGGATTGGMGAGGGSGGMSTGGSGAGGSPGGGGLATGGSAPGGSGGSAPGGSGGSAPGASGGSATAGTAGSAAGAGGDGEGGGATGGLASAGASGAGGDPAAGGSGTSPLPPTSDYAAPGPFATTTDRNVGPDGQCTIFRPATLGENGFLHAPIVFGPGIGMQATQLQDLLLSFATHGFVVIGTGVLEGGPNDPDNRAAMENALDWILEQDSQPGIFEGKLDVEHAISMGYSVGGTAAVEIGGHPAVATTVSIHGHIAEAALHGPLLQTSGTADTVGLPMQQQTFDASEVQTFLGTVEGGDHGYIQRETGGVERPAIIAWMRYWIYDDSGASHYFWGDDCVLCTAPWTNPQRKNWE